MSELMNLTRMAKKLRRAITRDDPDYYDMYENGGERYFARLYLHYIQKGIREAGLTGSLKILDAGCQAGRLAIPLAQLQHQVTGVDTSDLALRRARAHAQATSVVLDTARSDLGSWARQQKPASFDLVLCAEVLYMRPNYRELLQDLIRLLRPDGLLMVSHRPTAYYLVEAMGREDPEAAALVSSQPEGKLWGSYYNWQDRAALKQLYGDLGIGLRSIDSIGLYSWLLVNPEELSLEEQDQLFHLETEETELFKEGGRYLFVTAQKGSSS